MGLKEALMPLFRLSFASVLVLVASCGGSESPVGLGESAGGSGGQAGGAGAESDAGGASGTSGGAGGGAAGAAGAGGEADKACLEFATQYCARLDACSPVYLKLFWDDVQDCTQRLAGPCIKALALPDTTKTPAWTSQCAAAMTATSCEALLRRDIPAACVPPAGSRSAGSVCGEDGQCATSYCQHQYDVGCGTCMQRASAGENCASNDDCAFGLGCTTELKCAAFGELEGTCDGVHPCGAGLSCVGANSVKQGVCKTAGVAGAACDAYEQTKPGCDVLRGYFCNVLSSICQELTLAGGGAPCGVVSSGYAICTGSATCKLTSQYSGNCLAAAADGQACNVTDGPQCKPLAQCLNGVCTAPEPAWCE
jgi:hypothetical protein